MQTESPFDYVFVPQTKLILSHRVFVGTKNHLITVPYQIKEGGGFKTTTTTYTIGGKTIAQLVSQMLNNPSVTETELINTIKSWDIPLTTIIAFDDIGEMKIKNKWFNRSILYKLKNEKGWRPLCHSISKEAMIKVENFYRNFK